MKFFITGISGRLGLNFALQTRERFQVSGCYYTHPIVLGGIRPLKLDVTSFGASQQALRKIQPDVIVHTAGLTNVEECEANPVLAHRLNVEAVRHVARIADALGAQLVHISTDHLFDGTGPWKTEADTPAPLNTYARTKWQAEQVVMRICPNALIVRTNFFGWGTSVRTSFSDWILRALQQSCELTMFSDVLFTPILINDLVDLVLELIAREATGIFHVAGGERLSKYSFALRMAEVFGYPKNGIRAIRVEDFPFKARRPKDMSLSSRKAEIYLQVRMPTVAEGLKRLQNLYREGWARALGKAVQDGSLSPQLLNRKA